MNKLHLSFISNDCRLVKTGKATLPYANSIERNGQRYNKEIVGQLM